MPQIKLLTTKNSWMVDSMEHGYECDAPSSLALTRTQQKSISIVMKGIGDLWVPAVRTSVGTFSHGTHNIESRYPQTFSHHLKQRFVGTFLMFSTGWYFRNQF